MQGDSLQVADTVRDVLGPALNVLTGLIEEDGECARCAGVLASTGVSISVWTVRPLHLTAVVPTHTLCRTSGCVTVEELPPATHNSVVFRGLHARAPGVPVRMLSPAQPRRPQVVMDRSASSGVSLARFGSELVE